MIFCSKCGNALNKTSGTSSDAFNIGRLVTKIGGIVLCVIFFILTAYNWFVVAIYVGLVGFMQYCVKKEENSTSNKRSFL